MCSQNQRRHIFFWWTDLTGTAQRLIQSLFAADGTLGQRATRSGFWVIVSYGGNRFLGLIRTIILARLLIPADLGLVGLAEVTTGFLALLTEVGMTQALIHRQDVENKVLDTAWMISILRGLLLGGVTFLAASLIAAFFETPALKPILQVMSCVFVINGLNSIGLILLRKGLDFRKVAYYEVAANMLNLISVTVAAYYLRNAWALILGTVIQAGFVLVTSYILHPYRPRLRWRSDAAKELLDYGKYILGSGIVFYLLTQGDDALVGKVLGTGALGLYGLAYKVSNMPSTTITRMIGQVALPLYAQLQNDVQALRTAYLRILKITSIVVIPFSGGLFVLAPELVRVLYGEKWMPMVPSFMILCIYGLERAIDSSSASIFQAIGRPRVLFHFTLFKLAVMVSIIYPLTINLGIFGTSIATTVSAIAVALVVMPTVAKALKTDLATLLKPLAGPSLSTTVMMAALYLIKMPGWLTSNVFCLIGLVVVGFVVYVVVLYLADRPAFDELRSIIALQLQGALASSPFELVRYGE
jgi:lipopolysaccharide exporter